MFVESEAFEHIECQLLRRAAHWHAERLLQVRDRREQGHRIGKQPAPSSKLRERERKNGSVPTSRQLPPDVCTQGARLVKRTRAGDHLPYPVDLLKEGTSDVARASGARHHPHRGQAGLHSMQEQGAQIAHLKRNRN